MEKQASSFLDQVKLDVASILLDFGTMRQRLQDLLINLTIHVEEHSDITGVQYLVDQLGTDAAKGINNRAVSDWLKAHCRVDIKYDKVEQRNDVTFAKSKVTKLDDGKAKPWWMFRPSKIQEGYNLQTILEAALSTANKKLALKAKLLGEGKTKEAALIEVTLDQVAALREMLHPKTARQHTGEVVEGEVVEEIEINTLPAVA